jgi:hypothetical protein
MKAMHILGILSVLIVLLVVELAVDALRVFLLNPKIKPHP